MSTRWQCKRDTAANWTANNPTLLGGEWGIETDTGKAKIGNGSTAWNSLGYAVTGSVYLTELITVAKGASAQASSTITIPAGAVVDGVTCRVIQSIDGTAPPTNFNVGWTGVADDAVLDNLSVAAGTTGNMWLASGSGGGDGTYTGPFIRTASSTLTVTTTDGADTPTIVPLDSATTFQVRLVAWYHVIAIPAS